MKTRKYRIVRDNYAGYECQIWRIWWPFWVQMGSTNTHGTLERAEEYIEKIVNHRKFVKEYSPKVPLDVERDQKLKKIGIK
jgi:hypothetical protein